MPEGKYIFVHGAARVTADERDALCAWTDSRIHNELLPASGGRSN